MQLTALAESRAMENWDVPAGAVGCWGAPIGGPPQRRGGGGAAGVDAAVEELCVPNTQE